MTSKVILLLLFIFSSIHLQTTETSCNCIDCKTITSGLYAGTYTLNPFSDQNACKSGCLYTNIADGTELCLCDPGTEEYALGDTCEGTTIRTLIKIQIINVDISIRLESLNVTLPDTIAGDLLTTLLQLAQETRFYDMECQELEDLIPIGNHIK